MKDVDLDIFFNEMTVNVFDDLTEELSDDLTTEQLYEAVIEESLDEDPKWMQHAVHKKGAFTAYCKRNGFKGVTKECIEKGLKSKDPIIRKRANLAKIFLRKKT